MGVTFVRMNTRSEIYYGLAILGCGFGIAMVNCQDFPRTVTKRWQVRVEDSVVQAILFGLIIWQTQQPRSWAVWYLLSGVTELIPSVTKPQATI